MKPCRVASCGAPTSSRFSPHCRQHKSRLRRQGHPEQTAIKKSELAPYIVRVRERIDKNQESPLWAHLDAIWHTIVGDARAAAGRQFQNRYQRQAANLILGLDVDCPPREIVVTTIAMFMFWSERQRRFVSDAAFRLQLVKRIRGLSSTHTGFRYDHKAGIQRPVYRELSPKAAAIVGHTLAVSFGAVGLQLAKLEDRDQERKERMKATIQQAIQELA